MGRTSHSLDATTAELTDPATADRRSSKRRNNSDLRPDSVAESLFAALEQEGIRYCHWKSNVRLAGT